MTLFIKLDNGVPTGNVIAEANFRQLFPNVSFPAYFVADAVESFGYGIYDFSAPPVAEKYKKVVEIAPVRTDAGIWRQTWQIVDMTAEEKVAADAQQAAVVRAQRNQLLALSDWTQVIDAPFTQSLMAEWQSYRQALRDVPAQVGFPWEVQWPTEP